MNSIDLIQSNLRRSQEIVLSRIEEMAKHCLVRPLPDGGCHTLWILGHLAFIESFVIHQIMLGEPNQVAGWKEIFDGDEVSDRADDFPAFEPVLKECRRLRAETIARLATLTEADLDQPSQKPPLGAEELFCDFRSCFQYASDHWLMHRGQLAVARRAAGMGRMWY